MIEKVIKQNIDKELVKNMQSDDQIKSLSAFNQLYKFYKERITFYILKMVKFDSDLAEDLTQDVFVKIHSNIHQYTPEFSFTTWLYKVAKNYVIDHHIRSKNNKINKSSVKINTIDIQISDYSPNPCQIFVKKQRNEILFESIQHIKKENVKTAILLLYIEQLSYQEVTDKMNLPIGTIKTLIFRGKKEIKKYIEKKQSDY